jgi:hypothetical protein
MLFGRAEAAEHAASTKRGLPVADALDGPGRGGVDLTAQRLERRALCRRHAGQVLVDGRHAHVRYSAVLASTSVAT